MVSEAEGICHDDDEDDDGDGGNDDDDDDSSSILDSWGLACAIPA